MGGSCISCRNYIVKVVFFGVGVALIVVVVVVRVVNVVVVVVLLGGGGSVWVVA